MKLLQRKEALIEPVIPAKAGIQSIRAQRVTGSPLSRGWLVHLFL